MKCYNCNNIIPRFNNIYRGYDNNFCNSVCRLNIINKVTSIDHGNNNPGSWQQILIKNDSHLKKIKSINHILDLELINNKNTNIKNDKKYYNISLSNSIYYKNRLNLLKYLWTLLFIFYYSK